MFGFSLAIVLHEKCVHTESNIRETMRTTASDPAIVRGTINKIGIIH